MPKPSVPQGTVTASPDPCPVGDLVTITASDVTINGYANLFVYDSHGVISVGCTYDPAAHTVVGETYPSWSGESTVEVRDYDTQNKKAVLVAEGSFTVV